MKTPHRMISPSAEDPSAALTDPSPRCDASEELPEVQDYLDRVCAPLIGKVPYTRRLELRRELAEHLHALADAHEELGALPDEALHKALEQFGTPDQVGRQWLSAWNQGTSLPPSTYALTTTCFLLSSWLGCMLQVKMATQAGLTAPEALLVGPILPVLGGWVLCLAHRTRPWVTRAGLAAVPLLGAGLAYGLPARPDVSTPTTIALTAVTWCILSAATAGIAIHVDAWLKRRIPARATR